MPTGDGLGVHVTLDLGGRIRFGPDTEYIREPHYRIDPAKAGDFARAAQRYLPTMREDWLTPDFAGVRPKLSGVGEPPRDFVVCEESGRAASNSWPQNLRRLRAPPCGRSPDATTYPEATKAPDATKEKGEPVVPTPLR